MGGMEPVAPKNPRKSNQRIVESYCRRHGIKIGPKQLSLLLTIITLPSFCAFAGNEDKLNLPFSIAKDMLKKGLVNLRKSLSS